MNSHDRRKLRRWAQRGIDELEAKRGVTFDREDLHPVTDAAARVIRNNHLQWVYLDRKRAEDRQRRRGALTGRYWWRLAQTLRRLQAAREP